MVNKNATPEEKIEAARLQREWRSKNHDRYLQINRKGNKKYRSEKHDRYILSKTITRHKRRLDIQAFFGGKCTCKRTDCWHQGDCIITDHRLLQMDHINGGGRKDRLVTGVSIEGRYKLIKEQPDLCRQKYQLLCVNCNWVKRWENKEYLSKKED